MPQGRIHIVSGADDFLSDQRVRELKDKAHAALPDAEVIELDAASCTSFDFDEAVSPSLLSDTSVVVISHGEDMAEDVGRALVSYCSDARASASPAASIVIVQHNGSAKGSGIIRRAQAAGAAVDKVADLKNANSRTNFVRQRFEMYGRRINNDAAQFIADTLGARTGEIAALCRQLCDDFPDNPMTLAIARTYLSADPQVTGFTVADMAIGGDLAQAIIGMRNAVIQGIDPLAILGAIAVKIRSMAKASAVDQGKITPAEAKMSPWQLRNARHDVRGWTSEGLGNCIQIAAWVDEQCKSNGADPLYAMEYLLKAIASKGNIRMDGINR